MSNQATTTVKKKKILLVGWDSADWKIINTLLQEGHMQGVRSLMDDGAYGNLSTLEPQLSPMLWTSIATGKMAHHHGVHGFTEVDPISGQVVPVSAASRKCKTLWEILGEKGLRTHVVSWFATQGERELNGKMVSNMYGHMHGVSPDDDPEDFPPPPPGTYWPENLAEEMNSLRVSPFEIDEDILQPFVPLGSKIDQARDKRLNPLRKFLAESYSVHTAVTHLMETDPDWDFLAVYYRALDEISHVFMPYHPPKMEGIPEEDFEIYQHVVKSTYLAHDMMLQRLLQLAGSGVTVFLVSDHGFHSDHLRPEFTPSVPAGITVWHRNQGIFLAKGPGIQPTQEIYGASLLDITPTILHHCGLPMGADMEGRVLMEIFSENESIQSIPSWEEGDRRQKRRSSLNPEESRSLLEQFVALGYISDISTESTEAVELTHLENQWSLARSYLFTGQYEEALPLLEECHSAFPERTDYAQSLAHTQLALGLERESEDTLSVCLKSFGNTTAAHILQGKIAYEKGKYEQALTHLEAARAQSPKSVSVLELSCRAYVDLQRWDKARETAELLLSVDHTNIQAHNILTRCYLRDHQPEHAVETALSAIRLQFASPRAHQLLGQALIHIGRWDDAERALGTSLNLNRNDIRTLEALKSVYDHRGEPDKSRICDDEIFRLRSVDHLANRKRLESLRHGIAARARERQARSKPSRPEDAQQPANGDPISSMEFVIVSGLPRSGTSLMMQILHAGGMKIMDDGLRKADEDNPEGYWEWQEIKSLRKNPRLIEQAEGKVIKVVSALLGRLPALYRYRIIFMRRPVEEVVTSQWAMLARNGLKPRSEKEHLIHTQTIHVEQILARLRQLEHVQLIEIDYLDLINEPDRPLEALREFLGAGISSPEKLKTVIRPELYRHQIHRDS